MTDKTRQLVWALLAVLGTVGSLVMVLFPDLATKEEATTLGTHVPTMVLSTITVFITAKAIVVRWRSKRSQQNKEQADEKS